MKNMKAYVSITAIALLATVALLKGIDGALLATSIGLIAGLGGYVIGKSKK